jgi:signal transduction histidine kinase
LRTLAGQVAGEFAAAAARQGAQIEVSANGYDGAGEEAEVEAHCDPERVAQILRVLLDNSLTHAGEGAEIEVVADRTSPGGGRPEEALLTVADNGPGIDRRDLPHVFDRFHSGNNAQGTGLGLAIARELADRMLGRLEVSSQPGKTVFKLVLPLAESDPGSDFPRPPAAFAADKIAT